MEIDNRVAVTAILAVDRMRRRCVPGTGVAVVTRRNGPCRSPRVPASPTFPTRLQKSLQETTAISDGNRNAIFSDLNSLFLFCSAAAFKKPRSSAYDQKNPLPSGGRPELACAMLPRPALMVLVLPALFLAFARSLPSPLRTESIRNQTPSLLNLYAERSSPFDLEVSGELAGLPAGATRYVARRDLLALPQVTFEVADDANFRIPARVRGVELEVLESKIAAKSEEALIVAVSSDFYRGLYPPAYIRAHKPVLALEINGQAPPDWPRSREGTSSPMGPFLITHPHFAPGFKILAHQDEPQIPWGVVRLEFRNERRFYEAFDRRGSQSDDPAVEAGYRIAMQNCLRCHSISEEPAKARYTWSELGTIAAEAPEQFAAYVKNPQSVAPYAKMPANPAYDDPTLRALTAYFRAFDPAAKR